MSTKIFVHLPDDHACTVYRAQMPYLHLYSELSSQGIHLTADNKTLPKEEFDIFIFNRLIRPNFFSEVILPWNRLGKSFVWQCDDDLWQIPQWNPSIQQLNEQDLDSTDKYIELAKALWVSTKQIKDFVAAPDKTKILPNLVDLNHYDEVIQRGEGPIKILWCGGASHDGDFDDIIEPVIKLSDKYKEKIAFIFWGYLPTQLAYFERQPGYSHANIYPKYPNVFSGEWFSNREYFYKLRQLKPDIAIMPLRDCPFNYSKSNLKFLEMSMSGAACIATDLPPYDCILQNETGIRIKPRDSQTWHDALDELIINKAKRLEIHENARAQIKAMFTWQSPSRQLWLQAFLDLIGSR